MIESAYIHSLTTKNNVSWDESVPAHILHQVKEIAERLKDGDPISGQWPVNPASIISVFADACNMALGAALEVDRDVIEDAARLRGEHDTAHINRAELDSVLRRGKHGLEIRVVIYVC